MGTIPPFPGPSQEAIIGQLKQQIATLQAENERVKAAYNQVSAENRQLKAQLEWERRLFANPAYSPSEKLTILATKPLLLKSSPNEQGLYHIPLYQVAPAIGMNRKTVGRNFIKLAETTTDIRRDEDHSETALGTWQTDVHVAFSEQLLTRPDTTTRLEPRNQGGIRLKRCKHCGKENLVEETTVLCQDCGSVQSKTRRPMNPPHTALMEQDPPEGQVIPREAIQEEAILEHATVSPGILLQDLPEDTKGFGFEKPATPPEREVGKAHPRDNLSDVLKPEKPKDNLSLGEEKPTTPPEREVELPTRQCVDGGVAGFSLATAQVLLDIAGDTLDHIVMNENPCVEKKYLTVHSPLTLEEVRMHLEGTKTVGASLVFADGTTRALCFDADTPENWQKLQDAANELHTAGYAPFLERSPKRGGHLWMIFNSRVHAKSAYAAMCTIAPTLKACEEYWPRGNGYKVRLPAGKYVTPGFSEWCSFYDASGDQVSTMPLTPASLIPEEVEISEKEAPLLTFEQSKVFPEHGRVDDYHRKKYQDAHFWFAWTPAQLAEWYQERTPIAELLPPERNGNGLASWRGERTASVAYTKDGEGWVDFGASARRPDGKRDGGDCLELLARMQQRPKSEVMSDVGKILVREAKEALVSAARSGELPPAWVQKFMTDEGWKYYHTLCKSRVGSRIVNPDAQNKAHTDEEEPQDGGVAGFQNVTEVITLGEHKADETTEGKRNYYGGSRTTLPLHITPSQEEDTPSVGQLDVPQEEASVQEEYASDTELPETLPEPFPVSQVDVPTKSSLSRRELKTQEELLQLPLQQVPSNPTEPRQQQKANVLAEQILHQAQTVYWWQKQETLADKIPEDFFTVELPCERCGCALYRQMAEYQVCVRCYPPRGYHLYKHLINAAYPRKR